MKRKTVRSTLKRRDADWSHNCLLCQILWPMIVQHRHVATDPYEPKTLLISNDSLKAN